MTTNSSASVVDTDAAAASAVSAISWASVGVAYALNLLTLVILVVIFCAIKYCNRKRRKKYAEDDMPIYTRQQSRDSKLASQRSKISTVSGSSNQPMLKNEKSSSTSSTGKAYIRVNSEDSQQTLPSNNTVPEYRFKRDTVSQWCNKHNLSEHTAHRLRENGFTNTEYLECLTSDAIPNLQLRTTAEECKLRILLDGMQAAKQAEQKPARPSSGGKRHSSPHRSSHPSLNTDRQVSMDTVRLSTEVTSVFNSSDSAEFDDVDGISALPSGRSSGAPRRSAGKQENHKTFKVSDASVTNHSTRLPSGDKAHNYSAHEAPITNHRNHRLSSGDKYYKAHEAPITNHRNHRLSSGDKLKYYKGMLSDTGLYDMSEKIGMEWTSLATLLRITRAQQEQVMMNHPGNARNQIYEILRLWRDRSKGDKEQVKGQLHQALSVLGRQDLAEVLMRETVKGSNENVKTHSIV